MSASNVESKMTASASASHRAQCLLRSLVLMICGVTFAFASPSLANAQDVEPFHGWADNPAEPAQISDLNVQFEATPYFDTWDYWIWLDNDDFLFVQFVVSSFGFGIERQGSVKAVYVRDGYSSDAHGRNTEGVYRARRGFEYQTEWTYDADGFDVQYDDCEMSWDGEVFSLVLHDRTLSVDLELTPQSDLFRPGDGRVEVGWDRHYYYDLTVLPRFDVEGQVRARITRNDEEVWEPVSGVGYAEHSRINNFPFQIGRVFRGFRALRPDGLTLVYDDVIAQDGHDPGSAPWALVLLDGEEIFSATNVTVTPLESVSDEVSGHTYTLPHTYEVYAESGSDWVRFVVTTHGLVSRENPLAVVGNIVRAVLAQQMIPQDYEFTVDYDAWVHIDGQTAFVSGGGWQTFNYVR